MCILFLLLDGAVRVYWRKEIRRGAGKMRKKCNHKFHYAGIEDIETDKYPVGADCYVFVCEKCGFQRAILQKEEYEVIE
jgi:hypothetical protein